MAESKELRKQQRKAKKDVAMQDEPVGILPGLRNAPEQTPSEDVAMEDEQVGILPTLRKVLEQVSPGELYEVWSRETAYTVTVRDVRIDRKSNR